MEATVEDAGGFAKLPNALVERGILAHIRPQAVKVYQAILHAARSKTATCWPGVKTLARWSGVPRGKVPGETAYLERHRLISKGWVKIKGNPRRTYRVTQPTDPMYPDYRESCSLCMITDHRESCLVRDKKTGRLLGKRRRVKSPDHRDPGITDLRDSPMITDDWDTKQIEADEKIGSRRGGGVGEGDGALRFASPREAAPLRAPDPGDKAEGKSTRKGTGDGQGADERQALATPVKAHAARLVAKGLDPDRARLLAEDLVKDPTHREGCPVCRGLADGNRCGHVAEIVAGSAASRPSGDIPGSIPGEAAIDYNRRCEATTRAGLACAGRPLVGSAFCKRHQTLRETACVPVA